MRRSLVRDLVGEDHLDAAIAAFGDVAGVLHPVEELLRPLAVLAVGGDDGVRALDQAVSSLVAAAQCEKRSDAKDATSYNALIAVWTELTRQAAAIHDTGGDRQTRLDL